MGGGHASAVGGASGPHGDTFFAAWATTDRTLMGVPHGPAGSGGDYAKAVFPLGPGLVGLAVALGGAGAPPPRAPLVLDNAVLDPRFEPAGDVAVKLALQVCAAPHPPPP